MNNVIFQLSVRFSIDKNLQLTKAKDFQHLIKDKELCKMLGFVIKKILFTVISTILLDKKGLSDIVRFILYRTESKLSLFLGTLEALFMPRSVTKKRLCNTDISKKKVSNQFIVNG